jgi:hypothetical protein
LGNYGFVQLFRCSLYVLFLHIFLMFSLDIGSEEGEESGSMDGPILRKLTTSYMGRQSYKRIFFFR